MALSPANLARLSLLLEWVKRGKVAPNSKEAAEYQRLLVAKQTGVDPSEVPETSLSGPRTRPAAGASVASLAGLQASATGAMDGATGAISRANGGISDPDGAVESPLEGATGAGLARFYGVSERTIDIWRQKDAPLFEPAEMRAWWSRTFPGRSINPKILRAIARISGSGTTPTARSAPPADATEPLLPEIPEDEVGFDRTHRRMLEAEARLCARIQALEAAGNLPEADLLRQDWLKLCAALGGADTKQIRNALQRGDLLQRGVIEREYATLIAHQPEVLRAGLKAIAEKLQLPARLGKTWAQQVDALVDEVFRSMPERLLSFINRPNPKTHNDHETDAP